MINVPITYKKNVSGGTILGHHVIQANKQTMTTSHDTDPDQPNTSKRHHVPRGSSASGLLTS